MAYSIHIELPVRILAKAILECAEVTRIRMEPLALAGHEGRMCDLVVERALGSCEPAQIRIVAQHNCVISILLHEGTKACNTCLSHFLICHSKRSFPIECTKQLVRLVLCAPGLEMCLEAGILDRRETDASESARHGEHEAV